MKIRKIAALIAAAALTLALMGCNNESDDPFANIPQTEQTSGANLNPFESKPEIITPAVHMPDIPVNEASAFEYKFDSELCGMVITDYKLQSPKIHIPEKLENEKVVKVEFGGVNKDITHIIMPDSVKEFGFSDQIKGTLQFVNIPAGVTELSTSVIIAEGVTSIGGSVFNGCTSLTSITIPDSVTTIGGGAFFSCTSLTTVTIPDSVTSIGNTAFSGCTSLTSITIPDSVTTIGDRVFNGCTSLTSITIPDSVTTIGDFAFRGCESLTSVTIPDSVTRITSVPRFAAFNDCTNIKATYKGKIYDYEHIDDLYKAINGN